MSEHDTEKRAAAEAAVALVEDDMLLGLGTGSTAWFAVEALAQRMKQGLRVRAVPTSVETQQHAASLGIPLVDLADVSGLDLAIDGADEIEQGTLRLIKGLGGALVREKIIAQAARRFVVIGDPAKLVDRLGVHVPLPVEVTRFAHQVIGRRLPGRAVLRRGADGAPFVTDNGNVIYDCHAALPAGLDPAVLDEELRGVAGVVGHGLFLDCTEAAMIGRGDGTVQQLRPTRL